MRAFQKLVLDEDFSEDYALVAIHCSEEAYKMAFFLNKHVSLRLRRCDLDLDFSNDGLEVTFPLFEFEDASQYTQYHLVGNKCKSKEAQIQSSGGLFDAEVTEKTVVTYLLPELRSVDFFLKVSSDYKEVALKKLSLAINEIKQVISAYPVDVETIKSKNNLIFD